MAAAQRGATPGTDEIAPDHLVLGLLSDPEDRRPSSAADQR